MLREASFSVQIIITTVALMESDRDPAFYGDAVLPSEDDECDEAPQATLKLLGDFPEPLTEPQRRAVQHYVSQQVRDFELVRRQVAVVELGYLALRRLVKRLRGEQAALQASLSEANSKAEDKATTTTTTTTTSAEASPATTAHVQDASGTVKTTSAAKEAAAAPKRRTGGLLLRSAVFSGLQRVLQAAQTEHHDAKAEQLARQRERIAKESRLHLVSQDLAAQEALLEPLQRKYGRAVTLAQEAADKAGPLLALLEDMWRLEALYPSRFSMHAAGSLEPLMWARGEGKDAGVAGDNEEGEQRQQQQHQQQQRDEAGEDDKAGSAETSVTAAAATTKANDTASFVVPFTPAQYSSEVEDAIRAQVEDIIDEYLAYRTRMDPVLYQLEQAQQAAKAQKVDQLMDVIGIKGAECGAEVLPIGGAAAAAATATRSSSLAGKSVEELLHISSSEDDEDVADSGAGDANAADKDRQDREQIRTALTALDDFEDA